MPRGPFIPAFPELDDAAIEAEIIALAARLSKLRRERMRRAARERMRAMNQRPGFRKIADAALARAAVDPALREKRRALMRERMNAPGAKEKLAAANHERALRRYGFIIPERYQRLFEKFKRVYGKSDVARAEIKRLVDLEEMAARQTAEAEDRAAEADGRAAEAERKAAA